MNNFIIKKIYANNFKGIPFRNIKEISELIVFELIGSGLTVLSGPNGYGKTTMFDIIEIILSKQITRFKSTKFGNVTIKDNGLLNNTAKNGLIGIEFSNNKEVLSLLAKIPKKGGRGEIDTDIESIELFFYKGSLLDFNTSNVDMKNLENADLDKIQKLKRINAINDVEQFLTFNPDTFNLFYYISQEESTHFLKQKENDKLSTLDGLVDISIYLARKDLLDRLTSKRSNGIIKKRIDDIISKLDIKYNELKTEVNQSEKVDFIKVFDNLDIPWNKNNIESESILTLIDYKKEVTGTFELLHHEESLRKELFNQKLDKIPLSEDTFKDFLILKENKLIIDSFKGIKKEELSEVINKYEKNAQLQKLKEVYNEPEIENKLEFSDVEKWCQYLSQESITKEVFDSMINEIKSTKERLNSGERIYTTFLSKRTTLINAYKNAIKDNVQNEYLNDKKCPFCGTGVKENDISLYSQIDEVTEYLKKTTSSDQQRLNEIRKQLRDSIEVLFTAVKDLEIVQDISDEVYKNLVKISSKEDAQNNILELLKNILAFSLDASDNIKSLDSIKECIKEKKHILSDEYLKANEEFKIKELYEKYYKNNFEEVLKDDTLRSKLENEKKFIEYHINLKQNEKYNEVFSHIKKLTRELKLLEKVEDDFDIYKGVITDGINDFRDKLIKDIEIPLYLYTGKILQNYQRGLGVFIKKTDKGVKFVPDMKTEHEIINSFSSGQLSGFIIAFMLVMNKVYSSRQNVINTILIDDPVQTMDDINIASLVEVLRNEFDDKQIILSSHEVNKAIYMMYKFSKYQLNYEMKDVSKMVRQID